MAFTEPTNAHIDTYKPLGCGECLDWRWRQGTMRLARLEASATPEEYYAGPDEELLLADKTMVDFIFPYLRLRLYPGKIPEVPQRRMDAVHLAVAASQEMTITPSCYSLNLEAGLLGGRALGELMPGMPEFPPLAQALYEQLFFDVRYLLSDPKALCRLLLKDRGRLEHRSGYDWYSKIVAYGLGFEEYLRWRCRKSSVAAKAIELAYKDTLLYLDGLELLGEDRPEDFVEAHCRLFAGLPSIVARAKDIVDAGVRRWYHNYTQEEIEVAIAMVPTGTAG